MPDSGVGIVRTPPPDPNINASNGAIANLVDVSGALFDEIVVFDYVFADHDDVTCVPLEKRHSHNLFVGILTNLRYQFRLSKAIWNHRDDLDVTLWHSGGFSLLVPLVLTKLLRIEIALFVLGEPRAGYREMEHGGFVKRRLIPKLLFVLEVLSFSLSDRIVVFNEGIVDYSVLDRFSEKISTLRFNYQEPPQDLVDPSDRDSSLVYLGRICDLKGADDFTRAVELLLDRDDVELDRVLFVGDGPTKARWESHFAHVDGASDTVRFTGWLEHEDAMKLLATAKIFVLPSKSEGLPKTLIEAMTRGVVPVVTPVGNVSAVVEDGHDGILLESADSEVIADEIATLLEGPEAVRMARNSIDTAQRNFSYRRAVADFARLLERLDGVPHDIEESTRDIRGTGE